MRFERTIERKSGTTNNFVARFTAEATTSLVHRKLVQIKMK